MKILIIGPFSPPITGESLANDTVLKNLKKDSKFTTEYINNAFPIFKENSGAFSFSKTYFYFLKYINIYKVFRNQIVYITLGQTFFGVLKYAPFILLSKILNKKIIIHIHGNHIGIEYQKQKGIKKRILKSLVSSADRGIVLSELLIPNLSPFLSKGNVFILSNFVEDYLILPEDKITNLKTTDTLKIVYLSNLMTEKGVLDLIGALKILNKKGVKYKAKLAGNIDVSIKDKILSKIDKNNLIEYLGVVSGLKKKELLLWANVFTFPSYYPIEGQPISLLEAMATGNIILTTKHAGIPDIFSEANGFYINKKDPYDIASKLSYVAKNLQNLQPMMVNNYKYASSTFTEEKFINKLKMILLN
mgnify:CR=1 FL=1|jgi:glycosyltransferase involved in cell wall biosynthesis